MTFPSHPSNILILVGYGSHSQIRDAALCDLERALWERLGIPVQSAFLEDASPSLGESIQDAIAEYHPTQIIVLPLFLGASTSKRATLKLIVDAAKDRWPEIGIHYGEALGHHPGVIAAYADLLNAAVLAHTITIPPNKTALLVVGRTSRDAANQADMDGLAHILAEKYHYFYVETATYTTSRSDIEAAIRRGVEAGAEQVIVLPHVLYETSLYQAILQGVQHNEAGSYDVAVVVAPPLDSHHGILEAITRRYQEALVVLTDQHSGESTVPYRIPHTHGGLSHIQATSPANSDLLSSLLPLRYQQGNTVSVAPMAAADLIFDEQGQVAWDQIWGSFCDLALAGGPPHRGTLLEPVSPDTITADLEAYHRVLAELMRGIHMITKLPVVESPYSGWIGIQCVDEAMALWLLRAIMVENVSVRREGTMLYLPAGPNFRLEHEIKNVVTVVAKTHHYWMEHLNNDGVQSPP